MTDSKLCSVEGCGNTGRIRAGLCGKHYMRLRTHGHTRTTVKRAPRGAPVKWIADHVDYKDDECLEWPFARYSNGYAMINSPLGAMSASRFMCISAHGMPRRKRMDAAHSCGNGHLACCNPQHLRWATRTSNLEDRKVHGTLLLGEKHPRAKLNEDSVREIRRLRDEMTQSELGRRFGVSFQTVSEIQLRKKWTHVDD